ncbi:inhibitory synaptic factor 1 isoform X1 [Tachyglossus aculeatus]|uniref:inhibitory synaptic factor 1 isoform X1 n=2 Tax=Tachyglossus aculeatus TaxID=9261 RepID=UPI0018F31B64|nr:inhibitory synaptic factor 1 isoform X1 [Tachyglossus aculeatus]
MLPRGSQDRQPSDNPGGGGGERERIRSRMKMVIGQLEGILQELKEVAKELREVVSQIDKLTSDFDFELEPDDWTTATVSSTSSSDKGGGGLFDLGHLDFMTSDILSDSWEFCSFLDVSTPSDSGDGSEQPGGRQPDYRLMNGGVLIPNGPRGETPDSSSEEAFSSAPAPSKGQPQRTPGTRERVRFSDKVLYHALCCDDDEEDEQGEENGEEEGGSDGGGGGGAPPEAPQTETEAALKPAPPPPTCKPRRSPLSGRHLHLAPTLTVGGQTRKVTRNSSTQTVSDKSTQTALPYISAKQKIKGKN